MTEKILIIDDDLDTLRLVGLMLQRQGYKIVAAINGKQGLSYADTERPDLILLDVMMPEMDGYEVAKRLRANPDTAPIPILMFTAKTQLDDKVSGFEAGADDYLTKPTHPAELQVHVKALLARATKTRQAVPAAMPAQQAYTIGILAARGGHGCSTLALNLGSSLQSATKEQVIVAELRPGQGTLGADLGETNPIGLTNLLKANPVDITRQMVKEQLVSHDSNNIKLLLASSMPRDAQLINALQQYEVLMNRLSYLARFVVIDLGPGLPTSTQKIIVGLSMIIVIIEPMPNAIVHAKSMITDLAGMGINKKNILAVVVNRIRSDVQLNWAQVQEKLEHPVALVFTPAPELIYHASRMKKAAVVYQPDTLTGQQFTRLASLVVDRARQAA